MEKSFCRIAVQFLFLQLSLSPCAFAMDQERADQETTARLLNMASFLNFKDLQNFSLTTKEYQEELRPELESRPEFALHRKWVIALSELCANIISEDRVKELAPLVAVFVSVLPKSESDRFNNQVAQHVLRITKRTSEFSETKEKIDLLSHLLMIHNLAPALEKSIHAKIGSLVEILIPHPKHFDFVEHGGMTLN